MANGVPPLREISRGHPAFRHLTPPDIADFVRDRHHPPTISYVVGRQYSIRSAFSAFLGRLRKPTQSRIEYSCPTG